MKELKSCWNSTSLVRQKEIEKNTDTEIKMGDYEKWFEMDVVSIPGDSEPPFRRHSTAVPFLVIPRFRESDTEVPVR